MLPPDEVVVSNTERRLALLLRVAASRSAIRLVLDCSSYTSIAFDCSGSIVFGDWPQPPDSIFGDFAELGRRGYGDMGSVVSIAVIAIARLGQRRRSLTKYLFV
jgi:hypothetical protein